MTREHCAMKPARLIDHAILIASVVILTALIFGYDKILMEGL